MEFEKDPREAAASGEGDPYASDQNPVSEAAKADPSGAAPEFADQGLGPYREDGTYDYEAETESPISEAASPPAPLEAAAAGAQPPAPPPPPKAPEEEEQEEEQMLRMSFLEHLEELRARIIKALAGIGVAFLLSLIFANQLWLIISEPAADALRQIGISDPRLAQIKPMEVFSIVWIKLPMLTAIFLASPWVLYQAWAFIAPGLYRRERRWAGPFIVCSAGLFILGGLFAYFVAFRFGLVFLLGIGRDIRIQPIVSVTEYFDLFVNVILGVGLVFELPVLIFFLTLLRIVSPRFLLRNSRYAILLIVAVAALITPTPDVFNLMLFSVPMVLLYFVGIFASYLLVLHREGRRFPWRTAMYVGGALLAAGAGVALLAVMRYGYRLVPHWPFLAR